MHSTCRGARVAAGGRHSGQRAWSWEAQHRPLSTTKLLVSTSYLYMSRESRKRIILSSVDAAQLVSDRSPRNAAAA